MATLSDDDRIRLTLSVLKVLTAWQIPSKLQPALLGMDPALKPRKFNRYRLGEPLPDDSGVYERIGLLLSIDGALHQLFPHSTVAANLWITTPRVKFGGQTPLETMLDKGLDGIRSVEQGLCNLDSW